MFFLGFSWHLHSPLFSNINPLRQFNPNCRASPLPPKVHFQMTSPIFLCTPKCLTYLLRNDRAMVLNLSNLYEVYCTDLLSSTFVSLSCREPRVPVSVFNTAATLRIKANQANMSASIASTTAQAQAQAAAAARRAKHQSLGSMDLSGSIGGQYVMSSMDMGVGATLSGPISLCAPRAISLTRCYQHSKTQCAL